MKVRCKCCGTELWEGEQEYGVCVACLSELWGLAAWRGAIEGEDAMKGAER